LKRQIGTSLAVFAGVACNSGTEPPPPVPPETIRNEIVFSSDRHGGPRLLYRMEPDGTNPQLIPSNVGEGIEVSTVSPDGQWVAFSNGREIWKMRADGSELNQLTENPAYDRAPAWSPDGTRIAFKSDRSGPRDFAFDIFVMDTDGSNVVQITTHPETDEQPSWSPDGSALTFFSARDGNHEIYVVRLDGSPPVNISNYLDSDVNPKWSPDGRTIAFRSLFRGQPPVFVGIYLMDPDGSNVRLVPTPQLVPSRGVAWSPDGTRLLVEEGRDIWSVNLDGSDLVNLTNNPNLFDIFPVWAP